jgi:hypothetical protein
VRFGVVFTAVESRDRELEPEPRFDCRTERFCSAFRAVEAEARILETGPRFEFCIVRLVAVFTGVGRRAPVFKPVRRIEYRAECFGVSFLVPEVECFRASGWTKRCNNDECLGVLFGPVDLGPVGRLKVRLGGTGGRNGGLGGVITSSPLFPAVGEAARDIFFSSTNGIAIDGGLTPA